MGPFIALMLILIIVIIVALSCIKIVAVPGDGAREVLEGMGIFGFRMRNANTILLMEAMDRQDEIIRNLVEKDIHVIECTPVYDSLEDYYIGVTGGMRS